MAIGALAWSPDGQTVAVRQIGSANKLRLYSFPDFHQLAEIEQTLTPLTPRPACAFQQNWAAMSFTPDSKALWIECDYIHDMQAPLLATVKLNARTLEQEDTLLLDAPFPGATLVPGGTAGRMEIVDGVLRYAEVIQVPEPEKNRFGGRIFRSFLYVTDLTTKSPVTPRMEIPRDNRAGTGRRPEQISISSDGALLAVSMPSGGVAPGMMLPDGAEIKPEFDRSIDVFRIQDGVKILQLGGASKEYGQHANGLFVARGSVFLLSTSGIGNDSELFLIDVKTNSVIQRLGKFTYIASYPNANRHLAISTGEGLDIYTIAPAQH